MRLALHEGTVQPVGSRRRLRAIAFYALLGVLSFGLLVPEGWTLTLPVVAWLPDGVADAVLSEWVDQASIHRVHLMAKGLAHVLVTVSLLVQWRRPADRQAPMWLASAFFVMAIAVNLITGSTTDDVPLIIWIIFGLGVSVGVIHPSSPILKAPKPTNTRLLSLTAVMAVPFLVYAVRQLNAQISGGASDPHWAAVHYIFSAEFGLLLILAGFISSTGFSGWSLTAWMTGLAAVLMGLVSIVHADQMSTLGFGWGAALAAWGIAYVVSAERRRRRDDDGLARAGMHDAITGDWPVAPLAGQDQTA